MRYGIALHARGRPIVTCEAYDKVLSDDGKPVIQAVNMQGIVMYKTRGRVIVSVPTSNNPTHKFSTIDPGDGYGYEGSVHAKRGWRIKLDQIATDLPVIEEVKND